MARRPRVIIPGIPLHITQRSVNRTPMFFGEADFRCFLRALLWASERSGCLIHAYVLMSNHVHLLLTPDHLVGPPRMLKSIGALFVQHVNKQQARTGALWERRYRSSVVVSQRYFLVCSRYIELNPVRAGMVDHPSQYRWSSYHRNADGCPDALITPHPLYQALGSTDQDRRLTYRGLTDQALDAREVDDLRAATRSGAVLRGLAGVGTGSDPGRGGARGGSPKPKLAKAPPVA